LGRSKGGFATKIHAITDALGNPLEFILTGGQAGDIGQAETFLALAPEGVGKLAAGKAYRTKLLKRLSRRAAIVNKAEFVIGLFIRNYN